MCNILREILKKKGVCYGDVSLLQDLDTEIIIDNSVLIDEEILLDSSKITKNKRNTVFVTYRPLAEVRSKYGCIAYLPLVYIGLFSSSQIEAPLFQKAFENELLKHNIAKEALAGIGSIYLKQHEYAFLECAKKLNIPYQTFSEESILKTPLYNPSDRLKNRIGVEGVAEPVAQLLSGNNSLQVYKTQITVPSYKVFTYAISFMKIKKD